GWGWRSWSRLPRGGRSRAGPSSSAAGAPVPRPSAPRPNVAAAQRAVPLATEQLQLLRARYLGGGNVRLLEVLDALTQHLEARLGVPRAQRAYRLAVATEEQLLGRTVEP